MKLIGKHFLLSLLSLSLIFCSCKKEKLTKATQNGANTLSCKINGKVYVARTDLFSPAFTGGYYTSPLNNTGKLSLSANVRNGKDESEYKISLEIPFINTSGVYDLNKSNYCEVDPLPITINATTYSTRNLGSGQVTITYIDYGNRILSGTFSFIAVSNKDPNEKVTVSSGRFDIQTK